jgi:hypothetical protein
MRRRYRLLFASREDFKKSMAVLFVFGSLAVTAAVFLAASKALGDIAGVLFGAACVIGVIWAVLNTKIFEYDD